MLPAGQVDEVAVEAAAKAVELYTVAPFSDRYHGEPVAVLSVAAEGAYELPPFFGVFQVVWETRFYEIHSFVKSQNTTP